MFTHPDAAERNITTQFPEIFNKHNFLYFNLPDGRMTNFDKSAQYLDASRRTKDIGRIFSAVQCTMQQGKHKSLEQFLKSKSAKKRLANAATPDDVGTLLDELVNEYNDKYGMGRQIRAFYRDNLDDDGRRTLLGKIPLPSHLWQPNADRRLDARINLLLEMRNGDSHAATYTPLYPTQRILHCITSAVKAILRLHGSSPSLLMIFTRSLDERWQAFGCKSTKPIGIMVAKK